MAKDHKAIAKNDKEHKYTSLGTSIAQVDSQERERQEREQLMINTIHNDCSIELEGKGFFASAFAFAAFMGNNNE